MSASFQDNGTTATQLTPSSDTTHTPASVYKADLRGANFTGANMDGLDLRETQYSTATGLFQQVYLDYGGKKAPVSFDYPATQLGVTTGSITCPDGHDGPATCAPRSSLGHGTCRCCCSLEQLQWQRSR
ncbi:MAG TPA: pentapeptide repeat-containing protein [Microlunatus sp.]